MPLGLTGVMNKPKDFVLITLINLFLISCSENDFDHAVYSVWFTGAKSFREYHQEYREANPKARYVATAIRISAANMGEINRQDRISSSESFRSCYLGTNPETRMVDYQGGNPSHGKGDLRWEAIGY